MVQRFQGQNQEMSPSPDRRARKLAILKALSRTSLVPDMDKENNDPLQNNVQLLAYTQTNYAHSTPLKACQITDLDASESGSVIETMSDPSIIMCSDDSKNSEKSFTCLKDIPKTSNGVKSQYMEELLVESLEPQPEEIYLDETKEMDEVYKVSDANQNIEQEYDDTEFLENALGEEYKSLDESLQHVSTSNLLEEIEADLPPPFSLRKKLEHTLHTLTGYRTVTRLNRMSTSLSDSCFLHEEGTSKLNQSEKKLERLEVEAAVQKALTEQADKAIQLSKRSKSMGVELVESEKAFLLASLRYEMSMSEMKRLKIKGTILEEANVGRLTISDIIFQLDCTTGNDLGYFLCVLIEKENVLGSHILSDTTDGKLHFKEQFQFKELDKDFVILVQLYRFYIKESRKMILKKTVLRKLRSMPFISPGKTLCITNGHHNPHNFNCLVSGEIRLNDIVNSENGNSVILFNTRPQYPVAGEALTLYSSTGVDIKVSHSGFLNIFKKTCWHRRWYSQRGYFLTAWLYPDDQETGKNSIDSIFLPSCSDEVKQVGLDVCIRPNSFCVTIAEKNMQLLFSADSHKEMLDWIKHLNLVIHHFKVWKPEICRSI